ncbi:MAG TPA: hypothetical protein VGD54_03770 [Steroidobacteraceae bacterium]
MGNAYEIYAIRYATMSPRTPHLNFLVPDPHETTAADLDYSHGECVCQGRAVTFLFDCGHLFVPTTGCAG